MSLDIQLQIRNQANETRQSLVAVKSWEEKIEQRDNELIALALKGKQGYEEPTNANRPNAKKEDTKSKYPKKVEIQKEGEEKKEVPVKQVEKKISGKGAAGRSYEEWQKIDAMLKKKEEENDDDEDPEKPKETAEQHKENGNKFYKTKKYELAIREYSKAIELDPTNAVYYYNRATAFWASGNNQECEKDATEAIKYDPRYVKAYMRRALAREARGDDYGALKDLEQIQDKASEIRQIGEKLVEVRAKLGISPDGTMREVKEPKIKITQEEKPVASPKIKIVEEKPVEEAQDVMEPMPQVPRHVATVVEEESRTLNEPMITKPAKVQIVEEEKPSKPGKVQIVEEPSSKPKKVQIVEEPSSKPKKVQIVEEPAEKPKKVQIVEEEPEKPKKVTIVEEEPKKEEKPKKVQITEEKPKAEDAEKLNKQAMKEALAEIEGTTEKPVKAAAKKPKTVKKAKKVQAVNVSWSDVSQEKVPVILQQMDPAGLNKSLGTVLDAEITEKIVKSLDGLEPVKAFAYCLELSRNENFEYLIFDDVVTALRDDVKKYVEKYEKLEGADPKLARECKNKWF